MVTRERFSTRQFWDDIVQWQCTLIQYIGELCRYLLNAEASPSESCHKIRMACGNGLRPDIWESFQERFAIPRILEFYAATEGVVSLFNVEGEVGSIGRIPPYLATRASVPLIRYDAEANAPIRDEKGLCIRCAPDEAGEAIGALRDDGAYAGNRFEQYVDGRSSSMRIVRNVFRPGDAWFRTGDLMRRDERGFYYFVDRIGETFRWKGENVSCVEVANVIGAFEGVRDAVVYGVDLPPTQGRVGMAAVVLGREVELAELRAHITAHLPGFACPAFLRIREEIEVTGTFKYNKLRLVHEGFDPNATAEAIFFFHPGRREYVRLDQALYRQIQSGEVRVV
jgi:fatty-acyl-CoA synthase